MRFVHNNHRTKIFNNQLVTDAYVSIVPIGICVCTGWCVVDVSVFALTKTQQIINKTRKTKMK